LLVNSATLTSISWWRYAEWLWAAPVLAGSFIGLQAAVEAK
jgi:hypothetical protein